MEINKQINQKTTENYHDQISKTKVKYLKTQRSNIKIYNIQN